MTQDEHQVEPQYVMPPKEAARRLGVAASTLRRLAPTYERVHGPLPWEGDEAGGGRMWPGEAVARVQAARALVEEGRAKSLESALRALAGGAPPPSGVLSRPDPEEMPRLPPEAEELIEALRTELEEARRERADMRELRAEVMELRAQVAVLQALPAAVDPEIIDQALQAELRADQAPPDHPPAAQDDASTSTGDRTGAGDGPLVRAAVSAARWLEARLGRGRRS
jgi:hypothetical protein